MFLIIYVNKTMCIFDQGEIRTSFSNRNTGILPCKLNIKRK